MNRLIEAIQQYEDLKAFKKYRKPLSDEERSEVMKAKATWNHGPKGEETPAVWKSVSPTGEVTYLTNTHRAYSKTKSLNAAINKYHSFIKGTA